MHVSRCTPTDEELALASAKANGEAASAVASTSNEQATGSTTGSHGKAAHESTSKATPAKTLTSELLDVDTDDDDECEHSDEEFNCAEGFAPDCHFEEEEEDDLPFSDPFEVGHASDLFEVESGEEEEDDEEMESPRRKVAPGPIVVESDSDNSENYELDGESAESLAVDLDQDNRPNGVSPVACLAQRCGFTTWNLTLDDLLLAHLQQHAHLAASKNAGSSQYSTGDTYWIAAHDEAANVFEQLALAIFRRHTDGVTFDANRSGAEWWTVVMEEGAEVGLHWDRDYALEEDTELQIHPHVGTVLYLSDEGQPTVIFPCPSTVCSSEKVPPMESCPPIVSYPKIGKHITFDGRLLHGAFQELRRQPTAKRISFLVNVWLNWKPVAVERFEGSLPLDHVVEVTWSQGLECVEVKSLPRSHSWDFTTNGSRYRVTGAFPDVSLLSKENDNFIFTDEDKKWTLSGPFSCKKLKPNPPEDM